MPGTHIKRMARTTGNLEPEEKVQRSAGRVRQRVLTWANQDSQMKTVCLGNLLSILTIGIIYVSCMLLYPYLESVCIALLLVSIVVIIPLRNVLRDV